MTNRQLLHICGGILATGLCIVGLWAFTNAGGWSWLGSGLSAIGYFLWTCIKWAGIVVLAVAVVCLIGWVIYAAASSEKRKERAREKEMDEEFKRIKEREAKELAAAIAAEEEYERERRDLRMCLYCRQEVSIQVVKCPNCGAS